MKTKEIIKAVKGWGICSLAVHAFLFDHKRKSEREQREARDEAATSAASREEEEEA